MSDTAFEELAMPLFDSLYRYARCLADDRAEAEDLVQETYLKGLRGFASFAPGTNFRAWMFRILRNTFLTSRSGLRAVPLDDAPAIQDKATPETHLIQRVTRQSLRRGGVRLPVVFWGGVGLCDAGDASVKE